MRPGIVTISAALVIAMLAGGLGLAVAEGTNQSARPNLTGRVEMDDGGAAHATVFIDTARPKKGTSTFCPSCYADCRKKATTDGNGDFKIESLDPALTFKVLVVGDGCKPQFVEKVDPTDGPLFVSLEKRSLTNVPPAQIVHGRVIDPKGAPIEGAAVEAEGVHTKDGGGTWGSIPGLDPLAVTGTNGEFILTSTKPFESLDVKVEAHGFAPKKLIELKAGPDVHPLAVTEGATVTGRIVCNGKPLADVSVGIVSTERSMEAFTGNFDIGTDTNGRFAFVNLPPNVPYTLYGLMDTIRRYGATTPMQVTAGGDGSTTDAGDLLVKPGHRVAGKVVLSDGQTVPDNTRVLIGLEGAWDSVQTMLDKDGRFEVTNLPTSVVSVSVAVSGYFLSEKNASHDPLNYRMVGRVDTDITNLTILLEKGRASEPDFINVDMEDRPEQQALAGIENGARTDRTASWQISGRVIDGKTSQPVANFQITPGRNTFSQVNWDTSRCVTGSNGLFTVAVKKKFSEPVLVAEADGYLPTQVTAPQEDRTNFEITLQPGAGPSGVVLLPGGKPAAGVTVGLICARQQGMTLGGEQITAWRGKDLVQTTDASGHFSFRPKLQMENVVAAAAQGFKLVSLSDLAANPKMILDAWSTVKGTLRRPSGPGTNEDLDLAFGPDVLTDRWLLNSGNHAVTDDKGAFEFDHVPPVQMELSYRVQMGTGRMNGWRNESLQTFNVAPGQTVELAVNAGAREKPDQNFGAVAAPFMPARRLGPAVIGTVLLPDGKPAAGAQVALVVSNEYIALGKLTLRTGQDEGLKTTTDASGQFTLPGVEGTQGLAALSEAGYASLLPPFSGKSLQVKLEAWGEIHGTLRIGKRLGSNESVSLTSGGPQQGRPIYDFQEYITTTDDQGRFVITYAPPGEQYLTRQITTRPRTWTPGTVAVVNVKPGAITEVTMGGTGREVIGTVKFKNESADIDWKEVSVGMHEPPDKTDFSVPGRMRFYHAESVSNGAFVIEDVPPGTYDFNATRQQRTSDLRQTQFNIQSIGTTTVIVPAGPDGSPYDVGVVELRRPPTLEVGEPAPDLTMTATDGRTVHLTDFRGKYVLLHFFYPHMINADALSSLKSAFAAHGSNLVLLGVSFGPSGPLTDFARENDIKWTLATVNYFRPNLVGYMQSIGRPSGVSVYLIDPEGKIAAKGLRSDEIQSALTKVLAKK